MVTKKKRKKFKEEDFREILRKYQSDRLQDGPYKSQYMESDEWLFWPRFDRALVNQCVDGDATISRYGIWAGTVRRYIVQSIEHIKNKDLKLAEQLLIKAANGLAAFSEVQNIFDPYSADSEGDEPVDR